MLKFEGKNNVILFIFSKKFDKIKYEEVDKILNKVPQSINKITHEQYLKLKEPIYTTTTN